MKLSKPKGERYKFLFPMSKWTYKELDESIKRMEKFIEDHRDMRISDNYHDQLNKLIVERTKRIGRKK